MVPRYGYDYPCTDQMESEGSQYCPIPLVPFRGVNCSDAAGPAHPSTCGLVQSVTAILTMITVDLTRKRNAISNHQWNSGESRSDRKSKSQSIAVMV